MAWIYSFRRQVSACFGTTMVTEDCYELWLDPGMQNLRAVSDMLKAYDARMMRCYPVSGRVNSVANDDAECSTPTQVTSTQAQATLF